MGHTIDEVFEIHLRAGDIKSGKPLKGLTAKQPSSQAVKQSGSQSKWAALLLLLLQMLPMLLPSGGGDNAIVTGVDVLGMAWQAIRQTDQAPDRLIDS